MRRLLLLLALSLAPSIAWPQAPAVGSISDPVTFAIISGGTPVDSGLSAYDGKIVLLMYFTSW